MSPNQKKTVLVVDDEEAVLKLSRLILERAGYRVLLARNSLEALRVFRGSSTQIDLVLIDIEMPGMSGIALGAQIEAERPGIPVLLNSANPFYAAETSSPFLAKPYSPEKLKSAIAQALELQGVTSVECAAMPALATEGLYPPPDVRMSEARTTGDGASQGLGAIPVNLPEEPAEWHSTTALPGSQPKWPEAFIPIRIARRNLFGIDFSILRSAARKVATATRELLFRHRPHHAAKVWAMAIAVLVLVIVPVSLRQRGEGQSAKPYSLSLRSMRALAGETQAPVGTPLLLDLDITGLPQSASYDIQIVNGDGQRLWQDIVPAQGSAVHTKAAPLRLGTYFVRVYEPAGALLKEYELRVTEKH